METGSEGGQESFLDLDQKLHSYLERETHDHHAGLLDVLFHTHSKVISSKSHFVKYKRCLCWVPLYFFPITQAQSTSLLLSLVISAPVGRLVVTRKTKQRDTFPYSAKTQKLLTKHNQILQGTEVITPKQRAHEAINIL